MAGLKGRKPLIGVTGPDRGGTAAWVCAKLAIRRAGGKARRITPARPGSITDLDGLLIGGGADVDPSLYGEEKESLLRELEAEHQRHLFLSLAKLVLFPVLYLFRRLFSTKRGTLVDQDRDRLESELISQAMAAAIPILGICRGAQLLNVHLGGSLHQDLEDFYVEQPQVQTILPKKTVRLEPDSKIAAIMGTDCCSINGLHRQAIKILGRDLRVVGKEENGVVQAIEHTKLDFLLGVQWHPEYLPQFREQQALFRSLVLTAGEKIGAAS